MSHIAIVQLLKQVYVSLSNVELSFYVSDDTLPKLFKTSAFIFIIGLDLKTNFISFDYGTT